MPSPNPNFGSAIGGSCSICGWPREVHPTWDINTGEQDITWDLAREERYCVDSGRAVNLIPGDRCIRHGMRSTPCFTAVREPRCQHPRLSKNHPYPKCEECGRSGQRTSVTSPYSSGG